MKRITTLALSFLLAGHAFAATLRPEDNARLETLSHELNVPMPELSQAVAQADYRQAVLDAFTKTAESKPWYEYQALFLTDKRVTQGVDFWRAHAADLARAERIYHVPASVIVAIIGVETFYGTNMGKHPILDSLFTLAFYHPTRTPFFSKEFANFVKLGHAQGWDLKTRLGSYAGAMGMSQFMPSSYLSYAVDFDGDGHIDLFTNPADAIGSVAHYFQMNGWVKGDSIAVRGFGQALGLKYGFENRYPVKALSAAGLRPTQSLGAHQEASVLRLDVGTGFEYWYGLPNFYAITRYNRSVHYSMAVWQLGAAVKQAVSGDTGNIRVVKR